jgi:hypothetical protein
LEHPWLGEIGVSWVSASLVSIWDKRYLDEVGLGISKPWLRSNETRNEHKMQLWSIQIEHLYYVEVG